MDHFDIRYGDRNLEAELQGLGPYVVVTDEIPWQLYQHRFVPRPVEVVMPGTLEKTALDRMIFDIPNDVTFVGVGGGAVIDAAKYFAFLRGQTPVLVPTIISSNAHFSDFISVRKNGSSFGFKKIGWPKRVIVDYSLIRIADARLNRAGYGDLLFMQTALNDWRIATAAGKTVPVDTEIEQKIIDVMHEVVENASEIGKLTQKGLEKLMECYQVSSYLVMGNLSLPISAGAEHLFAWNLELTTGKRLIHGEIVSLGIVIASYLQKSHASELRGALDAAQVIYHPDQIGVQWEEIKETLLTVCEYNRRFRNFYTIYDEVKWSTALLNEIREVIYT